MITTVEVFGFAREAAWLPWAVQYFLLIGISCAAFFLSLPGLVWRRPDWRGVSRRALLAALVCGLCAPVALLADLHQPGRFLHFYLYPNARSWMAWGSFFIPLYLLGLVLYAWLCVRPQLARADSKLLRALAYGGHDNAGAIRAAAIVSALGALLILLYTGMEVMMVRAQPLWHSPLIPVFLALTAFAGGVALTALFEALAGKNSAAPLLNRWLGRSQWASLAVLAVWLVAGWSGASADAGQALASTRGSAGWLLSLGWLAATMVLTLWLTRSRPGSMVLPALLALHGAWLARWMIFIGGQGLPKIGSTFRAYSLSMTPDSALGLIGTLGLCLTLYILLTSFIPWDDSAKA